MASESGGDEGESGEPEEYDPDLIAWINAELEKLLLEEVTGQPVPDWQRAWIEWYWRHRKCGGEFQTSVGWKSFGIACTCQDKE